MNRHLDRARLSNLTLRTSCMTGAALALLVGCGSADPPSAAGSSSSTAATGGAGATGTTTSTTSSAGGAGGVGGVGGAGGGNLLADGCYDSLASDVVLDDVTFFQVVAIDARHDGVEVPPEGRNAPLVANRAAVVRAHFEVGASFTAREIATRVTVDTSAGTETFLTKAMANAAGDFMVDLPATVMEPGATYSVAIVECEAPTGAQSSAARHPATGDAALAAVETGAIKIHMVPFEVAGFVPDTSAAVIKGFRDAVFAVYPVTDVTITVGDVVPDEWNGIVDMTNVLVKTGVIQEEIDSPAPDVYYFGLVTGAATRDEYCDCPTGSSQELTDRAGFAAGAAFADQKAEDTLIHELGHLHMLPHAPCGDPGNVDPQFPYPDADITVEGYDVRTGALVPPTHKDMMAYCYPRWISDYNFDKLAGWVQFTQTRWLAANAQAVSTLPRAAPHLCFDR